MNKEVDILTDIDDAFSILFNELSTFLELNNEKGANLFKEGKYNEVSDKLTVVNKIADFISELSILQNRWSVFVEDSFQKDYANNITNEITDVSDEKVHEEMINVSETSLGLKRYGRLNKGLRLSKTEYRIPILTVLNNEGGKAPVKEILMKVFEIIRPKLKPLDYEPLSEGEIRWQNATKWERQNMINDGLLAKNSPYGIWELTDKGRKYLVENCI